MIADQHLQALGVSVWLDGLTRETLESGLLARRIASGDVLGAVANMEAFSHALASGTAYIGPLRPLAQAGWPATRAAEALRVEDARAAADLLLPVYERTNGDDGYVSLGISAQALRDPARTLEEARWLWASVNRPNLMVELPSTSVTLAPLEWAIAEGINVHATGLFTLDRLADVFAAFTRGLELRSGRGDSLEHVASTASFSLTRLDVHLDQVLGQLATRGGAVAEKARALVGRSGLALARLALAQLRAAISTEEFLQLSERGARPQRLMLSISRAGEGGGRLHAALHELVGAKTIVSVPADSLPLSLEGPEDEVGIESDLSAARGTLDALEGLGISLAAVSEYLEGESMAGRAAAFDAIDESIRGRQKDLRRELAGLASLVPEVITKLDAEGVGRRLWQADAGLWVREARRAEEVRDRLGWLHLPQVSRSAVSDLIRFVRELQAEGYRRVVLLGMGGSSLAPDVFRRVFKSEGGLTLQVLDSTDPAAILETTRASPPDETLYIVASKSGTTTEPLALLEHFWAEAVGHLGQRAAAHFVAITDPGTPLEKLAQGRRFRRVFLGAQDVGGRYSALSAFGLLPAALLGVDIEALLLGGARMAHACGPKTDAVRNPGVFLGAVLGAAASAGRRRLTIVADPPLASLADWIEQLVAESSGKEGRGILPVVSEGLGPARSYGKDRLFVYLRTAGRLDTRVDAWARAGLAVAVIECGDGASGLGAEFFRWEIATAVACHLLGVNAFDQPDVERAKSRTADLLKAYSRKGSLPGPPLLWQGEGLTLLGDRDLAAPPPGSTLSGVGRWLLSQVDGGRGIAILVYLQQRSEIERRLAALRKVLRDRAGLATTLGFGPRYLHSTGQIHKGGPDDQVFLLITARPEVDVPVPGAGYSFGVLEQAQALGDLQALLERGRRAFGLHLDEPPRLREVSSALCAAASAREAAAARAARRRQRGA